MGNLWYVGAILSILGSTASNLGVNIQKFSFMKNAKLEPEKQKPYAKQPFWLLGLGLVVLGSLGDFAALGMAAQSIVAPIGSVTLVCNVAFAHWGLKEPLLKTDLIGTAFIIGGSTLSVAFGSHTGATYTLDELRKLYLQPGFAAYAFIVLGLSLALYALIKKVEPIKRELVDSCQSYETALLSSPHDAQQLDELDQRIAELEKQFDKFAKIHPVAYCALSGLAGGQSLLFGKMLAEMIGMSLRGDNQMIYGLTYVFLACMLFCVACQLHFLAVGLSFYDAMLVVPIFQCFFISVSTLGGAAYFKEFGSFTTIQCIMFPLGFLATLIGVYILSSRKTKKERTGGQTGVPLKDGEVVEEADETDVGAVAPADIDDGMELKHVSKSSMSISSKGAAMAIVVEEARCENGQPDESPRDSDDGKPATNGNGHGLAKPMVKSTEPDSQGDQINTNGSTNTKKQPAPKMRSITLADASMRPPSSTLAIPISAASRRCTSIDFHAPPPFGATRVSRFASRCDSIAQEMLPFSAPVGADMNTGQAAHAAASGETVTNTRASMGGPVHGHGGRSRLSIGGAGLVAGMVGRHHRKRSIIHAGFAILGVTDTPTLPDELSSNVDDAQWPNTSPASRRSTNADALYDQA